jgi:hypothetical protein
VDFFQHFLTVSFSFLFFILDNFAFTDGGDDYGWEEWEEGETARVCAVFDQSTVVYDSARNKYDRLRSIYGIYICTSLT